MSKEKPKRANFGVIDYDHFGQLVDCGYPIKESDYLFLDQVANMQKDPKRGFWCTMSNEAFCNKKKITDSGLRTMQRRLVKLGLLEKQDGNKTGKRATALFFNPIPLSPSESDVRQKVTGTPSESDGQVRQKVTQSPSESDDERKGKEIIKERKGKGVDLPFKSVLFSDAWDVWKQYKKEQYKFIYKPIAEKSALTKLKKDSGGKEATAIEMIDNAIAMTWKGIFPIKKEVAKTPSYNAKNPTVKMTDWS